MPHVQEQTPNLPPLPPSLAIMSQPSSQHQEEEMAPAAPIDATTPVPSHPPSEAMSDAGNAIAGSASKSSPLAFPSSSPTKSAVSGSRRDQLMSELSRGE